MSLINKSNKDMEELYKKWENARNNFMMYALKIKYGNISDSIYNHQNADRWNKIISDLRLQIIGI